MSGYFEKLAQDCIARGAPEGFKVAVVSLVGGSGRSDDFTHCRVNGGVYPLITRGSNKGRVNWRKPEPGSKREYYFEIRDGQVSP